MRHNVGTCVVVRWVDELRSDILGIPAILICSHQSVYAVVNVGGVDQLQAAVVLALGGQVDHGADVVLLLERHVLVVPPQLGFRVPRHAERDAPVVVLLRPQELLDGGGN